MDSAKDPRGIPVGDVVSRRRSTQTLVALLVAASIGFTVACCGCTPAQLKGADTATTMCNTVERMASGAVLAWESEKAGELTTCAANARDQAALDVCKQQVAAHRLDVQKAAACVDSLDFACNALGQAVKTAKDTGTSAIPADVIDAVISSVAKLVRVLVDLGVKLPPIVQQLAGGGA